MRALFRVAIASLLITLCASCKDEEGTSRSQSRCAQEACEIAGTQVRMRFSDHTDFHAAPFPSDARLLSDGRPDLAGFPNPVNNEMAAQILTLLSEDARGFSQTAGVFFSLSGPIDPARLPTLDGSVGKDATAYLVGIDEGAEDFGKRYPITVDFRQDAGPFGAPNMLSLLPLQGVPLRPRTSYAAVVLRKLSDVTGGHLGVSAEMAAIAAKERPAGLSDSAWITYEKAARALVVQGVSLDDVAGLTAFTTGDPTAQLMSVTEAMRQQPAPSPAKPPAPAEVFDTYCVFQTTITMPVYQKGDPPFAKSGGGWVFDAEGRPVKQGDESANFVLSVPRSPMPEAGYPVVIFSRTGGGGERPLVDRGVHLAAGAQAAAGSGPAQEFAVEGFAAVSIDGPHGGLRNVSKGDEQFLMFNVANPAALRDNVRQSAAELAFTVSILKQLSFDTSSCPGAAQSTKFDTQHVALMGHSMGATIAPLTVTVEPRIKALMLSGAGGSWIENIIHKKKPVPVKGFAELLLGLTQSYKLHRHDPMLSLFQWLAEPADPPVYGRRAMLESAAPPHVLMMQGIVDHYILPPIANATSLSFGLDLAGESLDKTTSFTPLEALLPFSARSRLSMPVSGNGPRQSTTVVVQHAEDGIEDGHEVMFQKAAPKHQYRCFLRGIREGSPKVVSADAACD